MVLIVQFLEAHQCQQMARGVGKALARDQCDLSAITYGHYSTSLGALKIAPIRERDGAFELGSMDFAAIWGSPPLPKVAAQRLVSLMRVLVIDSDQIRAELVAEGLAGIEPLEVRRSALYDEAEVLAFAPDVVVIAAESPDRDTLDSLKESSQGHPVVMFVDRSGPGLAEQAVRAGVAAYVVDGLAPNRVRSILDVAMSRFALTRQLRSDLARAKADLESRKVVDRAKGLLMKERGLDEDGAYRLLRKLAMDRGKPIGVVAADLLAFAGVLKGDAS